MTPEKIRPLGSRVLVRVLAEDAVSTGGILLPETARGNKQEGIVVSVGPGKRKDDGKIEPVECAVGDKVAIDRWGGTELYIDGVLHKLFNSYDVIAVIES